MPWYNASWTNRFAITTDNTKVDEAIDNLLYDLSLAPAAFWSVVRSDGGDIRVTQDDGTTELAREVSGFNAGSSLGSLYFKVSDLSISVDKTYYVYYGNASATEPAATDTFGKNNVWTSYIGVWHFDDAASPATESSSGKNATSSGGLTFASTGKIRTGVTVNGLDGKLSAGNVNGLTAASMTFSAWINPNSLGESSQGRILAKNTTATALNGYQWSLDTTNRMRLHIGDAAAATISNSDASVITLGSLQHVAVTYNGINARFYVNGIVVGAPALTRVPTDVGQSLCFGNNVSDTNRTFDGILDEIRQSTFPRATNWLRTEFNNQGTPSTFWTTGSQENVTPPTAITDLAAVAVSATQVDLTWTPASGATSHRIERAVVG